MRSAIGVAPHTGWALVVAIGEEKGRLRVLAREKIQLASELTFEAAAVYHQAEDKPLPEAKAIITDGERTALKNAKRAVAALVKSYEGLEACGISVSKARVPSDVEKILKSHALIHASEGALYRDAIIAACEASGLSVTRVGAKEIPEPDARITELGREAGKPWTKEHRTCATLACLALATSK